MTPTRVTIPFKPRNWQKDIYQKLKKTSVLVVHRGAGKSVFLVNNMIRRAITGPSRADYAYVLPKLNQAERNVWSPFKYYGGVIPGTTYNNSTHVVTFPNKARIFVLGADDPDSLRGMHLHGIVLDEFGDMRPDTMTAIYPMLTNHQGFLHISGTPRGRNQFYHYYQMSLDPLNQHHEWYGTKLTWQDTNALPVNEVERLKREMPEDMFLQEMECDFTAAFSGSYWGPEIKKLEQNGRILPNLYRSDLHVSTAWDLGIADSMSVWFFQELGDELHIIDYEEHDSLGFEEWKQILENRTRVRGYKYKNHFAPHDIAQRELTTGVSRLETAKKIGINFFQVPIHKVQDGILFVRQNLPRCKFDSINCAVGVDHLMMYQARLDRIGEDVGPLHDEHSHSADAFRYLIAGVERYKSRPPKIINKSWMAR